MCSRYGHGQEGRKGFMEDKSKYFVVKQKAVPEVLLKVVEAKETSGNSKSHYCAGSCRPGRDQPQFFFINIRTIFFLSMITQREKRLHW